MVLHNLFSLRRCTCVKYLYLLRMNFRCTFVPVNISIPKTISGREVLKGVLLKNYSGINRSELNELCYKPNLNMTYNNVFIIRYILKTEMKY